MMATQEPEHAVGKRKMYRTGTYVDEFLDEDGIPASTSVTLRTLHKSASVVGRHPWLKWGCGVAGCAR
jgi:hypothetical protein